METLYVGACNGVHLQAPQGREHMVAQVALVGFDAQGLLLRPGVFDEIPLGKLRHRRHVALRLAEGARVEEILQRIERPVPPLEPPPVSVAALAPASRQGETGEVR